MTPRQLPDEAANVGSGNQTKSSSRTTPDAASHKTVENALGLEEKTFDPTPVAASLGALANVADAPTIPVVDLANSEESRLLKYEESATQNAVFLKGDFVKETCDESLALDTLTTSLAELSSPDDRSRKTAGEGEGGRPSNVDDIDRVAAVEEQRRLIARIDRLTKASTRLRRQLDAEKKAVRMMSVGLATAAERVLALEDEVRQGAVVARGATGTLSGDVLDTRTRQENEDPNFSASTIVPGEAEAGDKEDSVAAQPPTSTLSTLIPGEAMGTREAKRAKTTPQEDTLNETKNAGVYEEARSESCLTDSWAGEIILAQPLMIVTPPVSPGDGPAGNTITNGSAGTTEERICSVHPGESQLRSGVTTNKGTKKTALVEPATATSGTKPELPTNHQASSPVSMTTLVEAKEEKTEKEGTHLGRNQLQPRQCIGRSSLFKTVVAFTFSKLHGTNPVTKAMAGSGVKCVPVLCAVLTFAIHAVTIFAGEFVWDDRAAVLSNPDVLGQRSLFDLLRHDFWGQHMALEVGHTVLLSYTICNAQ